VTENGSILTALDSPKYPAAQQDGTVLSAELNCTKAQTGLFEAIHPVDEDSALWNGYETTMLQFGAFFNLLGF
jgi:hypothetical protein